MILIVIAMKRRFNLNQKYFDEDSRIECKTAERVEMLNRKRSVLQKRIEEIDRNIFEAKDYVTKEVEKCNRFRHFEKNFIHINSKIITIIHCKE